MKDFTIVKKNTKPVINLLGRYTKITFTRSEAIDLVSAIQPSLRNGKNTCSRELSRELSKALTVVKKCISGKEKYIEDGGTLLSKADAVKVIATAGDYAYNIDKELANKCSHLVSHIISNAAWERETATETAKIDMCPTDVMNVGLKSMISDFCMTFGDYLPQPHLEKLVVAGINYWLSAQLTGAIKKHASDAGKQRAIENENIVRAGYSQLTEEFGGIQLDIYKILGDFAF